MTPVERILVVIPDTILAGLHGDPCTLGGPRTPNTSVIGRVLFPLELRALFFLEFYTRCRLPGLTYSNLV